MPMGYGAVFAVNVKIEDLEKLNMPTYQAFIEKLKAEGSNLDEYAHCLRHETEEKYEGKDIKGIHQAFEDFRNAFEERFNMEIFLEYHNKDEEGSVYDEVDGGYFALNFKQTYRLTKEAENLQKELPFEIVQYVTFG